MGNSKKKSNNKPKTISKPQIAKSEPIPIEQKKKLEHEEPVRPFSNVRTKSPDGEILKEGEERGRHKTERNQDIYKKEDEEEDDYDEEEEEVLELEGNNLFVGCDCLEEIIESLDEFQEYLIDLINDGYNLIQPVDDDNNLLVIKLENADEYSEESEEEEVFGRRKRKN